MLYLFNIVFRTGDRNMLNGVLKSRIWISSVDVVGLCPICMAYS